MRVLLAVSGGIDSMCLADMYARAGGDFAVAHCNFHLRGADSDADALFVEEWARSRGVRFFLAGFDTAAYAAEHGVSIEMAARELRYAWFARVASEHGFDAVAVAHNANDNAETLILNLLRGTGLRGITGMAADGPLPAGCSPENRLAPLDPSHCRQWAPPSYAAEGGTGFQGCTLPEGGQCAQEAGTCGEGIRLLRPLLGMTRAEIEEYARENGVEYREDRTNAELEYKRNRIRNAVFPEFARINPSFVRTLNADMKHFAQAGAVADGYFNEAKERILAEDGTILVDKLLEHKHWEYLLYRLAEPCGFSERTLDQAATLLAERAGGRPGTFSGKRFYSPTHVLETSPSGMTIRPREEALSVDGSVTVDGPGAYSILGRTVLVEMLPCPPADGLKQPAGTLVCDASALPFPFTLRGWLAGDWMRPFGMGGRAKKLSDLFADAKFSLTGKESAVVVYSPALDTDGDGRVAAVAGLRMDEALRVAKGSVNILKITVS